MQSALTSGMLSSCTCMAVVQPLCRATFSAARCARRWMAWSLLMFPSSSTRLTMACRCGMPLLDSSCSHTEDLLPDTFVLSETVLPSLSRITCSSKATAKSFQSCFQSLTVKFLVCSIAGLISMRMTLFLIFGWFIVANFISVQIPVASKPCGMKLSHIRVIFSGCFLFLDSPDTYSIALMPWATAFALAIIHRPPCRVHPLYLPGNCSQSVRTARSLLHG